MNSSLKLEAISRQRIGVLGYGREGRSAVQALRHHAPEADLTVLIESGEGPVDAPVIEGAFDERLQDFDILLRSPGVPVNHPALRAYRKRGGRVVNPGSIWFAERDDVPVVGVTGSKGKSTTASLLAHMLTASGRQVLLAGNIGVPLLDHLHTEVEIVVLEMSSYQLADIEGRLELGLITRLFPEHLDWHDTMAHYVACKLRLADLLEGHPLLVNAADPVLMEATANITGRIAANRAPYVERRADTLILGDRLLTDSSRLALIGHHNLDNMALAIQAGVQLGCPVDELVASLNDFEPLPHRLEPVATVDGVRWINDSIATSPHATLAALEALGGAPVTLIVGGKDRRADWSEMIEWAGRQGLQGLVTLPDNGESISAAFERVLGKDAVPQFPAADMETAVMQARSVSRPGSVVLLSPGAPSFPHFKDFEDRGRQFANAVLTLTA